MHNRDVSSTAIRGVADWLGSDWRIVIAGAAVIGAAHWLGLQSQDVLQAIEEEKRIRSSPIVQIEEAAPQHEAIFQRSINEAEDGAILTDRIVSFTIKSPPDPAAPHN